MTVWTQLEPLLAKVQKPARYIGCEDGAIRPRHDGSKVAWLLVYPDTYEIGLPNQGLQILYEILNERPDALAERSYAPWTDLEGVLRSHDLPLFSVDTHRPAGAFDLLAFNLSAELVYTNLLNCIDLAGVPVRAAERRPEHPLIVAGGHCTYNPEPLADFLDVVVLGDGEEVVGEISEVVAEWKAGGRTEGSRQQVLRALAAVPGVYVPSMYDCVYDGPDLLAPTRLYLDVARRLRGRAKAFAHITGGGILGNLERVLPEGRTAELDWAAWERPQVFRWLARHVDEDELRRVFNLGIGWCAVVAEAAPDESAIGRIT